MNFRDHESNSAQEPAAAPIAGSDPAPPVSGFWCTLREAIAGSERDYTCGPIGKAVVLLAIPMVLEMAMESVFAICDVFFVSRLGTDAVAAVGLTEAMLTIFYAIAVGISVATTAMVARRIGEKNRPAASLAAMQAIAVGVMVSLLFAVPTAIFADDLLRAMGGSVQLVADGAAYPRILFGGSLTIMLLFLINAAFRGAGDAAVAMRALWLANGINIVLDPCLIFGLGPFPELGLAGAAIATTIGRGLGVTYLFLTLVRGRSRLRLDAESLRLRWPVMRRLLRVSVGGIMQYLVSTSSWIILVRIVSMFGAPAVAGYTIAIRIIVFALLPSWGVCNAAATLMGQNLGAGQPDRAGASVWRAALYNVVFLVTVAAVFILKAEWLIRIFTSEPEVIRQGVSCLRIVSYGYAFYAYGMVMAQAFNGAGDTFTPTLLNLGCYWLFQIPLAWLLANRTHLAADGVYWAIVSAETALAVAAVLVFRRGRWKRKEI